jgi:hypothetical protein
MKLENLSLEKVYELYSIVKEFCGEYSKMTDNYALTTGDKTFENIPEEFRSLIETRQKLISYKLKLNDLIINKIIKTMENNE